MIRTITKHGLSWKVENEPASFWDKVQDATWEPFTFEVLHNFLTPWKPYLDIGAWIGPTVLYGAQYAAHCYALEPDPIARQVLERNLALNPALQSCVTVSPHCIAERNGPMRLGSRTSGGDSMSSLLFADQATGWAVKGRTLESFIAEHDIKDYSLIKMDIEGGEFDVLPQAARYLAERRPPLLLSVHPLFLAADSRIKRLSDLRYALRPYVNVYTSDCHRTSTDHLFDPKTFNTSYELLLTP